MKQNQIKKQILTYTSILTLTFSGLATANSDVLIPSQSL